MILLDHVPKVERVRSLGTHRTHAIVSLHAGSGVRKATGTFYTPQPIAAYLIRAALQPLVRDATPDEILNLKVLDPSMGSGAFLVGACAYLGDAYEAASSHTDAATPAILATRAGDNPSIDRRTLLAAWTSTHGSPTRKVVAVACYAGR
jgi:hypothetical protein